MQYRLEHMHAAIGRAVLWAQVFETVFSVCFQLIGMVESGVSILTSKKHFKTPIRNLIKELSSANNIAPEFEVQINNLIERRHLLIHRWYQENGIPSEEQTTAIFELIELARGVEKDSKRISGLLAGYIVRWGKMNPEQDMMLDTERTRLLGLFQRAHLGDTGE